MENFSIERWKSLTSVTEQHAMIEQYFVPLNDGSYAVYEDGEYKRRERKNVWGPYFNKFGETIRDYYTFDYPKVFIPTHSLTKPN
jgi:hypothetical protein